jgi:hypothetical protein
MTTQQECDILEMLISKGIPTIGVLMGIILGAYTSGYIDYRKSIDNFRINCVNTLQGDIVESLRLIDEFLERSEDDRLVNISMIETSLVNLKDSASGFIRNGYSTELMIKRKGNRTFQGSVKSLELVIRDYDPSKVELTDELLFRIKKLILEIEGNYGIADYDPDNFFSYIYQETKRFFIKGTTYK